MSWSNVIFLISVFYLTNQSKAQDGGYRLPETYIPSKYVVDLELTEDIFTGTNTAFTGVVDISFQVYTNTNYIKLHHRVDNILDVTLSTGITEIILANYTDYNSTTHILTIETVSTSQLFVGTDYNLNIRYTNNLETSNMQGFYRSSYQNADGQTEYLVTTQFQPTHARHAFPCFDEPQYKAAFVVSITYPSGYNALSNTPSTENVTVNATHVKTTFDETPIMSTYLIAFIVSTFSCTSGETIATNVPHRVCSRQQEEADRAWAVEIGPPLMRQLESMTGIKYGSQMAKMDQVAIPDFSAGAMENWGLVTYRETGLLWSQNDTSNAYKKSIALVIAHEFTHMWFGNLVTCKWWDYTFLNEGFARFYQYFAAAITSQLQDWELEKHFNVEQVHTALLADSSLGAQALTSKADSPSEVSGKFGTITYNKGASIYRMVEQFMGPDNFLKGIKSYLSRYSLNATIPENLWSSLNDYVPNTAIPTGTNLSTVIENWVEKSGHPVVTVTKSGNDVILTQKRFLLSGTDNTEYYVPISYTLSSDTSKFSNTTAKVWLAPGQNVTLRDVLNGSDWIIINNRQSGFYRVNYDNTLWTSIKSALNSNHLNIDVLNRAQIVSDAYNFARSGANNGTTTEIEYSHVLSILSYLRNEVDYYPWYAAIVGNNHVLQRIGNDSTEGIQFTSWMLKLLQKVYYSVPFETLDDSNQVYTMKQAVILGRVCKYGDPDCITKAKNLFDRYKNNGDKVPKNLRNVVYCNALRHSDDIESDFNFLWQQYQETKLASEIVTILAGLGCTENTTYLKWFLDQTVNSTSGIRLQDFSSAWSYVYSSSKIGANSAMEYITENYSKLNLYYSNVGSLISNIANYFYAEDQIEKLEALLNVTTLSNNHKLIAENALNSTKSTIIWATDLKQNIKTYLDSEEGNSPSSVPAFETSLVLVCIFAIVKLWF